MLVLVPAPNQMTIPVQQTGQKWDKSSLQPNVDVSQDSILSPGASGFISLYLLPITLFLPETGS